MSLTPVLLCTYRPTYLHTTLKWLRSRDFERSYRLFVWNNGGAEETLRAFDISWQCVFDDQSGKVRNVGKAMAMRYLVDTANDALPELDCYVCIDDDIAVDVHHLDTLVAAARRPGLGMVAGRMHPFNSVVPPDGRVEFLDPCTAGCNAGRKLFSGCTACGGLGRDRAGLQLLTYPPEDRLVRKTGRVAGGLFAVSKAALAKTPWAPHLYPILADRNGEPVPYWTEDASLDHALTQAGLLNGYLQSPQVNPAIHLPDLDDDFARWKKKAREAPLQTAAFDEPLT